MLNGERTVTTPALFYHNNPLPPNTTLSLTATGRLDELDSVGRLSPSLIGFAFNNRLLFGGFAGEPQTTVGALNPLNDPAGENMTLLAPGCAPHAELSVSRTPEDPGRS